MFMFGLIICRGTTLDDAGGKPQLSNCTTACSRVLMGEDAGKEQLQASASGTGVSCGQQASKH